MKEEFDPNRAYNRDAINKEQKIRVRLMDEEALNRGREIEGLPKITDKKDFDRELKLNPQHKVFTDVYTGKIIRGGDAYDFEHIVSANYLYMKLRGTHTEEEIAKIVNNPKNVGVTRRDINNHKKQHNLKDYILDKKEKIERFGIDKNLAKKALIDAENSINSLSNIDFPISYDNNDKQKSSQPSKFNKKAAFIPPVKSSTSRSSSNSSNKSSNSKNTSKSSSSSNSANTPKVPVKLILGIIVIIILLLLFLWFKNIFPFDNKNNQTNVVPKSEIMTDENKTIENNPIGEGFIESKMRFAKPLDDLTKSVTDISEFNSIVENQNIIPVIGSMFEYNSADISNDGKAILAEFANEYKKLDFPYKVLIEGFTCTIGSKESNEKLGKVRADNLKSELNRFGIAENLIVIKPIGMQNFVSTNNGKSDLVLNRRSNVTIISAE
ncbi:MAG: OmpA family protein [Psychroserpens sp.]|uniref:OmpA family protein n=1 Tax=Psychroserpens sp. TaxID=2020870 RepID=UPI00300169A1